MPTWEMGAGTAGGRTQAAGTTRDVFAIGFTEVADTALTEAAAQTLIRDSYTWANFFVRVTANATTATTTVRNRVNSADGAMSVSIGSGATGVFEDTTNSNALVTGDLISIQSLSGAGGTITYSVFGSTLQHASANVPILQCSRRTSIAESLTRYVCLSGAFVASATEANAQYTFRVASTLSRFRVYVSSNANTATTTCRTRLNAANGAQSVSVAGSSTGSFEDTTNTDTVVAGDEVNFQVITGAGTGAFVLSLMQVLSTSIGRQVAATFVTGVAFSADSYLVAEAYIGGNATESASQKTARSSFTAKNMFVYVSANTTTAADVYLRKNGANSALTVSVASGTTGVFEDTTNSVDFVAADTYNWFVDITSGTSITFTIIGFELAQPAAVGGQPTMRRWGGMEYMVPGGPHLGRRWG